MNVFTLLAHTARRWPTAGAVWQGTRCVQDWATLHRRARALGAAWRAQGLAGERVLLLSENQPAWLEALFGVWAAQAVAVPVNAKLHPREVAAIAQDAGARLALVSQLLAPAVAPLLAEAAVPVVELGSATYEGWFGPEVEAEPSDTDPDTLAWLFYTSGTTGRSKGAMLTHRNLMAMTLAHLADIEPLTEQHSQVHAAPMSHGSGLYILPSVARGVRQVVPASAGFDPTEFLDLCDLHPGCGAFLAPTMVQRLRLEAERRGRRPAQLRSIVYGGGPMYVEELKKAMAVFGPVFAQIYGQGESPMTITGLRREDHVGASDAVLGSVGQVRTGCEVRVVDAEGRPLPAGTVGEIICRGDVVMRGYWRNEAGTADALRQGWLWTGDMGALDAQGWLTLRDRSKDVVISGGSNIYPREVEEVLLTHPGVAEVCVLGQPDAEWGEVVVAFVVPADAAVTPEALDAHCLAHIARFKRPKAWHFIDALPKNAYGKVLKRQLRDELQHKRRAAMGGNG